MHLARLVLLARGVNYPILSIAAKRQVEAQASDHTHAVCELASDAWGSVKGSFVARSAGGLPGGVTE